MRYRNKIAVIKDKEVRSTGHVVWSSKTGLCEEKQIENYGYAFLAGREDLNQCKRKQGPKALIGGQFAAFTKNLDLSHLWNKIRMRSLVPLECKNRRK